MGEIHDRYQWPSIDWYDFSEVPDQVRGREDCVIRGGGSEPFATYKWLRGVEQGYIDLYENPEMVHYCLERLYDLCYEQTRRVYEQAPGRIIWTWVAEDLGTQQGLLVSLDHIREYLVPHMKRMVDLVHEGGGYAFHHSDGAVRESVPAGSGAGRARGGAAERSARPRCARLPCPWPDSRGSASGPAGSCSAARSDSTGEGEAWARPGAERACGCGCGCGRTPPWPCPSG